MAAAKKTAKARPSRAGALSVAAAKQALADETRALRTLCKGSGRETWQIGKRLAQVAELGLHRAAGFKTVDAYAEKELALARTKTFQYLRVAAAFTEAMVAEHGMDKLEGALAYFRATPEEDGPADVPRLRVRVPNAKGKVIKKAFAKVTVRELAAARRHEADVHAPRPRPSPEAEAHAAVVARGLKAVRATLARSNTAGVAMAVASHDGLVTFELRGVPLADGPAALRALAASLPASA